MTENDCAQCDEPLRPDGDSMYFCSHSCQDSWYWDRNREAHGLKPWRSYVPWGIVTANS